MRENFQTTPLDAEGMRRQALLSPKEMYRADALAMRGGTPGTVLMNNAGWCVARAIMRRHSPCRVLIACGPGNNGGDGFVIARFLAARGWPVKVALLGERTRLVGDGGWAAGKWDGEITPLNPSLLDGCELVVDALFGAGLSRPLEGIAAEFVERLNARRRADLCRTVAVDVPSGLDGAMGRPQGEVVVEADLTVSFFRAKPGHLLMPGRELCGELEIRDIGIPDSVLEEIRPRTFANAPDLWKELLPQLPADTHKYRRGHLLVVSGDETHTGAARLAAMAGLRAGAGLVTVASPAPALAVNAAHLTAIMLARCDTPQDLAGIIHDRRIRALVIGPAAGVDGRTRDMVLKALAMPTLQVILDADALTAFREDPETLFEAIRKRNGATVLTPHDGEFARLFPEIEGDRLTRARAAAAISGAVMLLKGPDAVIAEPDGMAVINGNAPPWLATAGSGDVLAGMAGALCAQGMPAFAAVSAAVWMHGEAARRAGPAMTAEDLPAAAGEARASMYKSPTKS